ncbi:MAG TPA: hypothetical protein VEX13_17440 [Chloroflexia bacterium]|nr:hypothetical protein [Chloroflexia bacterium]
MTTYLTSLVKRALGETPAVRPVLPPSWATPPGTWDAAFPETLQEFPAESAPPARARRTAYTMSGAEPEVGLATLQRAPSPRPAEQPTTPAPIDDVLSTRPSASPRPEPIPPLPPAPLAEQTRASFHVATGETPRPPAPDIPSAPLSDQPRPSEAASMPAPVQVPAPPMNHSGTRLPRPDVAVEPVIRRDAPAVVTPEGTERAVVPAKASPLPSEQQAAPTVAIVPRSASERIVPMPQEPNLTMAHPADGLVPSRSGARSQTPAPPAPPTIRVSIGRIEVRAVMSPAPTPAPAPPAAPMLTLEAYLRERTGRPGR